MEGPFQSQSSSRSPNPDVDKPIPVAFVKRDREGTDSRSNDSGSSDVENCPDSGPDKSLTAIPNPTIETGNGNVKVLSRQQEEFVADLVNVSSNGFNNAVHQKLGGKTVSSTTKRKVTEGSVHDHSKIGRANANTDTETNAKPNIEVTLSKLRSRRNLRSTTRQCSELAKLSMLRPCSIKIQKMSHTMLNRIANRHKGPTSAKFFPKSYLKSSQKPVQPLPSATTSSSPLEPPNWEKHLKLAMLSTSGFQTFPVDVNSKEYQELTQLIYPFQAISIGQLVNPELWKLYTAKYTQMLLAKSDDPNLLTKLGMEKSVALRRVQNGHDIILDQRLMDAKYSPHEVILFHASSPSKNFHSTAADLQTDRTRLEAKEEYEGDGMYFTDRPELCIRWETNREEVGIGTIFLFTVLLGDNLLLPDIQLPNSLCRTSLPKKEPLQRRYFDDKSFDSISAVTTAYPPSDLKTGRRSNQFVIFDKAQSYPLYIVKYSMSGDPMGADGSPRNCKYASTREAIPPIAWTSPSKGDVAMPNPNFDGEWPILAKSLYEKMGVGERVDDSDEDKDAAGPSASKSSEEDEPTDLDEKLAALQNLGLVNHSQNQEALQKFNYDVDRTANYLLGLESSTEQRPISASRKLFCGSSRSMSQEATRPSAPSTSSSETNSSSESSWSDSDDEEMEEESKEDDQIEATPLQPPNWTKNLSIVQKSSANFKTFPVDKTSLEHSTIAELLHPLIIVSIDQVVNPQLWKRYTDKREDLLTQTSGDYNFNMMQLGSLVVDSGEVRKLSEDQWDYIEDRHSNSSYAKYAANNVLLFYCPRSDQHLDKILNEGPDLDDTSMNGFRQGNGFICFSDDPLLPVKRDGTNRGRDCDPVGTILIFAVTLGDCLYQEKFPGKDKISLDYQPGKVAKIQQRNPDDITFDSVTSKSTLQFKSRSASSAAAPLPDPRKGKMFNEYVIFNKAQCCPLYMVKFRRDQVQISGTRNSTIDGYNNARRLMPTMAWRHVPRTILHLVPMPNLHLDKDWPFFADNIFEKMGVLRTSQDTTAEKDQDKDDK